MRTQIVIKQRSSEKKVHRVTEALNIYLHKTVIQPLRKCGRL